MANHTTAAQRHNARMDRIFAKAAELANAKAAESYIRTIRNAEKRRYAEAYARFLRDPFAASEPDDSQFALSYMAKQAVRMSLAEMIRAADAR